MSKVPASDSSVDECPKVNRAKLVMCRCASAVVECLCGTVGQTCSERQEKNGDNSADNY